MRAIILTCERDDGELLALRPLCGIPLVRRHLYTLRNLEWRQALILTDNFITGQTQQFPVKIHVVISQHVLEFKDFLMFEGIGHGDCKWIVQQ